MSDAEQLDEAGAPDPREPPYMPSAPHDARTRGEAKVLLLTPYGKTLASDTAVMDRPWGVAEPGVGHDTGRDTRLRGPSVGGNYAESHHNTYASN